MTLSAHCEPYMSESIKGVWGSTFCVFIKTEPPSPFPARTLSFTATRATPCSKIINKLLCISINFTIPPYILV